MGRRKTAPLLFASVSGAHLYGFPSPEAVRLRAVLAGGYSYDELMALVAEAEAASALPAEPDAAAVEALVVNLRRRGLDDERLLWPALSHGLE